MAQIVTLTSDWASSRFYILSDRIAQAEQIYPSGDHYVAQLKAQLLTACPELKIVDISHQVPLHNCIQAAYILKSCYNYFPDGSIHIMGVNSYPSAHTSLLVFEYNTHFFIGPNDGVFSMVIPEQPAEVIHLNLPTYSNGLIAFASIAHAVRSICSKIPLLSLGKMAPMVWDIPIHMKTTANSITGRVVFIDVYGNAITNITEDLFYDIGKNRPFVLLLHEGLNKCNQISHYYDDVDSGDFIALFNSNKMLEIAIRDQHLAQIHSVNTSTMVRIEFVS